MLGGPVEGLAIEWKIDHLSEKFVLAAYKLRSERLEKETVRGGVNASDQMHEPARNDIKSYFRTRKLNKL